MLLGQAAPSLLSGGFLEEENFAADIDKGQTEPAQDVHVALLVLKALRSGNLVDLKLDSSVRLVPFQVEVFCKHHRYDG